ncbi:MAG: type IV secretory system conjugative DNA transfer family protein, partial [Comamonadaceae bacterium]
MKNLKWAVAVLSLVLAIGGGAYAAGWITLLLLKLDTGALTWDLYGRYWRALELPAYRRYAGQIQGAGYVGFGIPLLLWVGVLFGLAKLKTTPAIHGDARFANGLDLRRYGFFKRASNGILVGKFNGKLVRLPGQQFVILAAPTRSGKGVGIVIPNLLEYGESMVVLDIKQENFELTSGWRASQGQEVYLFNPFAEDRKTHRWNPLTYVSSDPAFRVSDLMSIAAMLYPDGADDQKFWVSQARNAFMAFSLYLFDQGDHDAKFGRFAGDRVPRTLGQIYRMSSGDGTDLRKHFETLAQAPFLSAPGKAAFANLLSQ